jgi:hypothetical protein
MKSQPIIIQLIGGLGNQLNGLAAGIAVAGHLNRELIVDSSRVSFGSNLARRPELNDLRRNQSPVDIVFTQKDFSIFDKYYEKLRRHSKGLFEERLSFKEPDYWDTFEAPLKQISNIDRSISTICGPFMDFGWAELARQYGFPDECFPIVERPAYIAALAGIQRDDIAVHIRLGDYLKLDEIFPIVSEGYLLAALSQIPNLKTRNIVVFTDSPHIVRKRFPNVFQLNSIKIMESNFTSLETMSLMSKYQTVITSNSTFSSWAAWFSEKDTVITPVPHHRNGWIDKLPSNWTRIPIDINLK